MYIVKFKYPNKKESLPYGIVDFLQSLSSLSFLPDNAQNMVH